MINGIPLNIKNTPYQNFILGWYRNHTMLPQGSLCNSSIMGCCRLRTAAAFIHISIIYQQNCIKQLKAGVCCPYNVSLFLLETSQEIMFSNALCETKWHSCLVFLWAAWAQKCCLAATLFKFLLRTFCNRFPFSLVKCMDSLWVLKLPLAPAYY